MLLEAPLPGRETQVTPMQQQEEASGFLALMGMAGAKEGISGAQR